MWRLVKFISTLSVLLFSQSLRNSSVAADHLGEDGGGVAMVSFKRLLLLSQRQQPVADEQQYNMPHELGIHVRKVRSRGRGFSPRARGRTSSSSAVPTRLSAALLACCFFLPLILL
ncbi:hypothetical protein V6N13_082417 [Hibiscus sabdariffa]|uniref:Uncharacterized protein n=1 Tax=Hibiscus sabdariffa TaxID=183260 RepID=A0ABR2Q3C0_9ROSI